MEDLTIDLIIIIVIASFQNLRRGDRILYDYFILSCLSNFRPIFLPLPLIVSVSDRNFRLFIKYRLHHKC
jgi:hypothetical protein